MRKTSPGTRAIIGLKIPEIPGQRYRGGVGWGGVFEISGTLVGILEIFWDFKEIVGF